MVTNEEREWLAAEMGKLVERTGINSYVAAPLVEANDRWFPDEWHRDDGGVARLAKRVCQHAGISDVRITTELGHSDDNVPIRATNVDANSMHLVVDPDHLTDALTAVAALVHLATYIFRLRNRLQVEDTDEERKLIELTAMYLGFGILLTNAAYRYRASGEIRGNTVITRWSHDVQGALPADALAFALAMQLVARRADASELRAVRKQLETNQAEAFDAACDDLTPEHVDVALGLPPRDSWPARREPPAPTKSTALVRRKDNLPAATVKNRNFLGHNTGKPVLRREESYVVGAGFGALFLSMVPTIALAVNGYGGLAMLALVATTAAGFFGGSRIRHDICFGRGCGVKVAAGLERCPRCGGTFTGRMLKKENLLEAEERLQLDQGDEKIDVGEPEDSGVALPSARVHRGVDSSTTGIV